MVKVEEVESTSSVSDLPEMEDVEQETGGSPGKGKQNRMEKKFRKVFQKLNLLEQKDIMRVTVRKAKHILFVIPKPDVYKCNNADTFVIIGEARIEDLSAQAQANAAQMFSQQRPPAGDNAAMTNAPSMTKVEEVVEEEEAEVDEDDADETGIDDKDIELVMSQVSCTRAKAVGALKKNGNDVVEAIMHLSN